MSINTNSVFTPTFTNSIFQPLEGFGEALPPGFNDLLIWTFNEKLGNDSSYSNSLDRAETPDQENSRYVESNCVDLDGTAHADFGIDSFFEMAEFTVSFWINTADTANIIFETNGNKGYTIQMAGNKLRFNVALGQGGSNLDSIADVSGQGWTHIALVNSVAETKKIYINGSLDTSEPYEAPFYDATSKTYLGGRGAVAEVTAELCDLRIFSTGLNSTDVSAIYNNTLTTTPDFQLTLAEGSGQTVYDVSGNGKNGTGTNLLWDTQDNYHYNITKGFRESAGVKIPVLLDGTAAADGNAITNPADYWHNNAETKFIVGAEDKIFAVWNEVASSSTWSGRNAHNSVVFNNKIWVMGGYDGSVYKNDVYSSVDGITWTQETSTADWQTRGYFGLEVYNNKMWVIGGYNGTQLNDVWSSSDGITWTDANATGHWPAKTGHATAVYDNKLWVMGGTDTARNNDVWYSTDGTTWTNASASGHWTARNFHAATVHDGKMWISGGTSASGKEDDVWSTTDGATWTQATASAAWSARSSHCMITNGNKMYVLNGFNGSDQIKDVWYSTDGATWTEISYTTTYSKTTETPCISYEGIVWVIGTSDGTTRVSDIHNIIEEEYYEVAQTLKDNDPAEIFHNAATGFGIPIGYADMEASFDTGDGSIKYAFSDISTDKQYKNLLIYKTGFEPTLLNSVKLAKFIGQGDNLVVDEDGNQVYDSNDQAVIAP